MNPKIIYEDNKIIVAEKMPGILSQADSTDSTDMLSLLKSHIKEKYNKPGDAFVGLVHRLDKPVGGVMVFARNSKAAGRLSNQVRTRSFKKTYLAIVEGKPTNQAKITDYLKKNEQTNLVEVVSETTPGAQLAILTYKVLRTTDKLSLLEIELETGRRHQIRVQLANIGCPIVGDSKYGNELSNEEEIALWAYKLQFVHPGTNKMVEYTSKPPKTHSWNKFSL